MGIRTFGMAALLVTAAFVSVAAGEAPMGLPAGYLGEGQWGIGAEYGYGQMDLKTSGTVTDEVARTLGHTYAWSQDFKIDQLKSNMAFGTIGYGLVEGWDIFARLGASDARGDVHALPPDTGTSETQGTFNGHFGFAYGGGTRVTFYNVKPLMLGGLIQGTWFQTSRDNFRIMDPYFPEDETWTGKAKLNYWQIQASLAAALQVEKWRFWAGPFVQYSQGKLKFDGQADLASLTGALTWSSSLRDPWQVGGHFGVNWDVCDQFHLWGEGQVTADTWLVSIGAVIIPQKSFGI